MRKIKEILRLHGEHKLSQRQIARSAGVSQSTVHEYIARAQTAGITWPLPEPPPGNLWVSDVSLMRK